MSTYLRRYRPAAAPWLAAVAWVALGPNVYGVPTLLAATAVTTTLVIAIQHRDDRLREMCQIAFWAGAERANQKEDAHGAHPSVGER